MRAFPTVYVPFGPIEWHGRHLPLGTDALKAHGILCKTAEAFGGVVHPPIYFHNGFDQAHLVPLLTQLFTRLRATGFRVILGVSGHNVREMITMIDAALQPVIADGRCAGMGAWEFELADDPQHCRSDHAAKWETSDMMYLHGDRVDMGALGDGELNLDMKPPSGIGGEDPRTHASFEVGRRCVELAANALGEQARKLLASLPAEHRAFSRPPLAPGDWWMV